MPGVAKPQLVPFPDSLFSLFKEEPEQRLRRLFKTELFFFYVSDTDIKELEDVFGLNGQVEHKLNFLKKNVSKDIKLVLIAHSIGCYITLEMMKRASELQVLRSVLLFPTIERMAQSPQGKLMTPLLCKLRYILYMPVYLLSFLPEGVKASLVRFALRGMKTCDESSITTSVNLFSVDCIVPINLWQFYDDQGENKHAVVCVRGFQASSFDNLVSET
ncbi:PREDICTED: UPF0554 protein C2orf43 homolog, partial [Tauraco erythrolophus]|uniref:UPF0554 protein C2orf43 homolog n=1 Tax=Tauraco erythrolophus TaxID=121530 RepID=UPI0005232199